MYLSLIFLKIFCSLKTGTNCCCFDLMFHLTVKFLFYCWQDYFIIISVLQLYYDLLYLCVTLCQVVAAVLLSSSECHIVLIVTKGGLPCTKSLSHRLCFYVKFISFTLTAITSCPVPAAVPGESRPPPVVPQLSPRHPSGPPPTPNTQKGQG